MATHTYTVRFSYGGEKYYYSNQDSINDFKKNTEEEILKGQMSIYIESFFSEHPKYRKKNTKPQDICFEKDGEPLLHCPNLR